MFYRSRPYRGSGGRRIREDDEGHAWSTPATGLEQATSAPAPQPRPQPRPQYQNDDQADADERRYAEA